ncbi:hypothetical protein [Halorarum salinum]|uniref:Rubrerythrin-like domain-containing protein n=1 Tax=Halorarum salinum TaxID=2743089 RepID=A0A7D5QBC7_9EURY|nr:hypothetical protein [Halobaculum salinum]QLG63057.1 hypothetical protein HUG12_15480 [Halobaculum salinum]
MSASDPTELSIDEFAVITPSVPAAEIDCTDCVVTFLGDPDGPETCPRCRRGNDV